jgi:hypothetical protein
VKYTFDPARLNDFRGFTFSAEGIQTVRGHHAPHVEVILNRPLRGRHDIPDEMWHAMDLLPQATMDLGGDCVRQQLILCVCGRDQSGGTRAAATPSSCSRSTTLGSSSTPRRSTATQAAERRDLQAPAAAAAADRPAAPGALRGAAGGVLQARGDQAPQRDHDLRQGRTAPTSSTAPRSRTRCGRPSRRRPRRGSATSRSSAASRRSSGSTRPLAPRRASPGGSPTRPWTRRCGKGPSRSRTSAAPGAPSASRRTWSPWPRTS